MLIVRGREMGPERPSLDHWCFGSLCCWGRLTGCGSSTTKLPSGKSPAFLPSSTALCPAPQEWLISQSVFRERKWLKLQNQIFACIKNWEYLGGIWNGTHRLRLLAELLGSGPWIKCPLLSYRMTSESSCFIRDNWPSFNTKMINQTLKFFHNERQLCHIFVS